MIPSKFSNLGMKRCSVFTEQSSQVHRWRPLCLEWPNFLARLWVSLQNCACACALWCLLRAFAYLRRFRTLALRVCFSWKLNNGRNEDDSAHTFLNRFFCPFSWKEKQSQNDRQTRTAFFFAKPMKSPSRPEPNLDVWGWKCSISSESRCDLLQDRVSNTLCPQGVTHLQHHLHLEVMVPWEWRIDWFDFVWMTDIQTKRVVKTPRLMVNLPFVTITFTINHGGRETRSLDCFTYYTREANLARN